MIQTRYKIICDGCGITIYPKSLSTVEEVAMQEVHTGTTDNRLFFHFHDKECKAKWMDDHLRVLTGTIIAGMSDGS